jgi:hypothetical protein
MNANNSKTKQKPIQLEAGKHYYLENGLFVFTETYHLEKGYCCGNGCRHCPYPKTSQSNKK